MINLLNEELEIQKQHELERYKAYEEACTEVNKYLIEKRPCIRVVLFCENDILKWI